MFKLMIADDNPYVLQTLNQNTDWEKYDLDLVGMYKNGKELFAAAKENMPDLVITDITMPVMDGIRLSSLLYQLNPHIKIIFISAYSDFEYATKAVSLHVFDYILKPILQHQLDETLTRVTDCLQIEQQQYFNQLQLQSQQTFFHKTALSHYVSRLLFHTDSETNIKEEFSSLGFSLPVSFQIYAVSYALIQKSDTPNQLYNYSYFQSILGDNLVDSQIIPAKIESLYGTFLLLTHNEAISVSNILARLCVDAESKMGLSLTIGYSNPSTMFSELPKLYQQSQEVIQHLVSITPDVPIASYADTQEELTVSANISPNISKPNSSYSKNVAAMRSFIENNYMQPITANEVAQTVFLSPVHANRCFSNECGMTIFNYITWYRLEQAKHFLANTDEQITQIAELVGYSGRTSFYLSFKRATGISPAEYRLQHGNYDDF